MTQELTQLLANYKDGVPVRIEQSSVVMLSVAAVLVVAVSALVIKYIKNY